MTASGVLCLDQTTFRFSEGLILTMTICITSLFVVVSLSFFKLIHAILLLDLKFADISMINDLIEISFVL